MSLVSVEALLFIILLVCTSICDLRTRQIPNSLPLAISIVGLFHGSPLGAFLGLLVTGFPYLLAAILSDGKIGGGDIKLMAACGVVLGPLNGTLQSIIGLMLVLLFSMGISFRFGIQALKQTSLPLAPFLALGGIAAFFLSY